MVRTTSARPSAGRPAVPAKMTSSILPPRSVFAPCSPITHARASTTLDLPEPFGPTTQVIPGSSCSVVADANDLKPRNVRLFKYTWAPLRGLDQASPRGRAARRAYRPPTPPPGTPREPAPALRYRLAQFCPSLGQLPGHPGLSPIRGVGC